MDLRILSWEMRTAQPQQGIVCLFNFWSSVESSPRWNLLWRGENLNFWFSPRESFAADARKSYCSFSRNNGELEEIDLSLAAAPVSVGCWSRGHPEEGKLLKIGRRHCVWAPGSLRVQFLKVHQPGPPRLRLFSLSWPLLLFLILLFLLIPLLPLHITHLSSLSLVVAHFDLSFVWT